MRCTGPYGRVHLAAPKAVSRLEARGLPVRQTREPHIYLGRCPLCLSRPLTLLIAGASWASQCAVLCSRGCDPSAIAETIEASK